ncbi:hypothetical protein KEH51_16505 [[Brevibacterium] frigoritolerans]|uniref:Uncharacterized protein n=1 Tax=Peribacillus frigoritolerans TaxID=450367 RepID=A0A941FR53_9BACI|nr:hypothetical protein [Peribacillus frigoritolerans]
MMKYKSYFIAGTGTILFNVYMNTNSMWSEMPWWLYLIIGGGLLIGIASFFEWKKQKTTGHRRRYLRKINKGSRIGSIGGINEEGNGLRQIPKLKTLDENSKGFEFINSEPLCLQTEST